MEEGLIKILSSVAHVGSSYWAHCVSFLFPFFLFLQQEKVGDIEVQGDAKEASLLWDYAGHQLGKGLLSVSELGRHWREEELSKEESR